MLDKKIRALMKLDSVLTLSEIVNIIKKLEINYKTKIVTFIVEDIRYYAYYDIGKLVEVSKTYEGDLLTEMQNNNYKAVVEFIVGSIVGDSWDRGRLRNQLSKMNISKFNTIVEEVVKLTR